ncbi:peptidyl-trna hydrolase domain-containing protein [Ophiostoma piceae UAMH 11346]|uniref:Peptidyl-trna hydrolase domain-containing protein n=1 Tax=Ophiostoma piceae (strain UAMH 11346) TaxID=1262450 RepID=S3BXT1_OPHP1|nr:peptidyl-trna hydrolase domain-containing protein [Ophiostoma piceae UAMH 11346]
MLRLLPLRRALRPTFGAQSQSTWLSTSAACAAKQQQMPSRPKPPPEDEIDEMFVKGTGPGGQKINKTNSAVQLRHIPTGIVVKSQATRSRSENRAIARGLLAARLDEIRNPDTCRTAALVASKLKKRANATKKARRKYKKLAGTDDDGGGVHEDDGEHDGEHDERDGQLAERHQREADTAAQEPGTASTQDDQGDAAAVTTK